MTDERYKKIMEDLGKPNSQSLLSALQQVANEAGQAAQNTERDRSAALISECRAALAEELAGWDLDPPLAHVKQAHDRCDAWLRSNAGDKL